MWLFELYGFLALTTVTVLASLGILALGLRRLRTGILILVPLHEGKISERVQRHEASSP